MRSFWILLVGLIVAGLFIFFWHQNHGKVPVESNFGNKIVYTTDLDVDMTPLKAHCKKIGGIFNECGTICEPEAAVCAEVCAFTCEEIPEEVDTTAGWRLFKNEKYQFSLRYPKNWNESGFVWLRLRISDLQIRCEWDGRAIGSEECDPLLKNDQIIRTGTVDDDLWRIEQEILRSLRLTAERPIEAAILKLRSDLSVPLYRQ